MKCGLVVMDTVDLSVETQYQSSVPQSVYQAVYAGKGLLRMPVEIVYPKTGVLKLQVPQVSIIYGMLLIYVIYLED